MPILSWLVSNVMLAVLLALAAWFVQHWLKRPGVARVLWVLALIKLVTPPLVNVPMGNPPVSLACTLGTCGCDHHSPAQTFVNGTLLWLLLAGWSIGAGITAWIAWRRWARFRRLVAHASPAPPEWQALAARLASELSIRCPEILAVPGRLPPLVIPGRPRPRMLLPMALLAQLNASQRTALLMHELVHLKRGDHLVRMLELAVRIAFWWLPVGFIGRQLRACEEKCCDAAVVARLPESRRDYAMLLLDVIDFASPLPFQAASQATAMSAVNDLEKRVRAILDPGQSSSRTRLAGVVVVGLACAIVPCQLHLGVLARSTPDENSTMRGQDTGTADLPANAPEDKWAKNVCCPS